MSFLLVHGWENRRPEGHGQRWPAGRLAADGHEVRYPQFPEPDSPVLGDWLALLRPELGSPAADGGERVLVCHSLSVLLWWQAAPSLGALQPDRVPLVAADDDPYFPGGAAAPYAGRFGLDADVISGARQLDLPAGYGPWPSVLAWCADPAVRLSAR